MSTENEAPAGWYTDPDDPELQRYWDGKAWARHLSFGYLTRPAPEASRARTHRAERQQDASSENDTIQNKDETSSHDHGST